MLLFFIDQPIKFTKTKRNKIYSMAKDPAFLFYPGDWLGGTMAMSYEEKGIYISLLMLQFNNGHMTIDMMGQYIGHMFGQFWGRYQDKFVKDDNGLYYNEKLEEEKNKRKAFIGSRYNNKTGKNQHTSESGHMTNHMENENGNNTLHNLPINKLNNGSEKFSKNGHGSPIHLSGADRLAEKLIKRQNKTE